MALYLGNDKVKINLGGVLYCCATTPIDNGWLLSFDNYILQDFNGLYLVSKESE